MDMQMAFCAILFLVTTLLYTRGEKCCLKDLNETIIEGFTIHGESIPMRTRKVHIIPCAERQSAECYMYTSDLLNDVSNTTMVTYFAFKCDTPKTVTLTDDYYVLHPNIISYLETDNCIFTSGSLSIIAALTRMTVLGFHGYATASDNLNCSYLTNVGSLVVTNNKFHGIDFLYSCQNESFFVGEMILRNLSLTELPTNLPTRLPTLQYLDVSMNNLTRPPDFPWNDNVRTLPMNLSRTVYAQSLYSLGGVLDIESNEYKREFRLDFNTYLDIQNHSFHGSLHLLSLTGCRVKQLHSRLFSNVSGLQYLGLGVNMLENISTNIFISLEHLKVLDLSINRLTTLHGDIFHRQKRLVSLDLSGNKIVHLGSGLFARMSNLQVLNLENNRIEYVNEQAFSRENYSLRKLMLANNPILKFPDALLYLYNLHDIGLQGHSITTININELFTDKDLYFALVTNTLAKSSLSNIRDIDMSNGATERLSFSHTEDSLSKVVFLLKYYKLILDHNPLSCDCHMTKLIQFVGSLRAKKAGCSCFNMTLTGTEHPFTSWKCALPEGLSGKMVLNLDIQDTYCQILSANCPAKCICYRRSEINSTIVDCRNANLTEAPIVLPRGKLELLLEGNVIQHFVLPATFCENIVELHIQDNGLQSLDSNCLLHMRNLQILFLNDNLLRTVPKEIQGLHLQKIHLGNNVFQCDCHSLWMKKWLFEHKRIIVDYDDVKCVSGVDEFGRHIEDVPHDHFVCRTTQIGMMTIMFIVTGFVAFLCLLGAVVLYFNWSSFKLCLYVYTGAHPFDKRDKEENTFYDAFVVNPESSADWVQNNIIAPLERDYSYKLFTPTKNFRFGRSRRENVQDGVATCRRLLVFLTKDSITNSHIQQSIEEGMNRCREQNANFIVPILHGIVPKDIDNRLLQRYMKSRTLVTTGKPNFLKRLIYFLPHQPSPNVKFTDDTIVEPRSKFVRNSRNQQEAECIIEAGACFDSHDYSVSGIENTAVHSDDIILEEPVDEGCLVFIWYADEDFDFMMREIVRPFETHGHRFILADKSFLPGASIQENILKAIEKSQRTVIILSETSITDEWLLYAFRFACDRHTSDAAFMMGLLVRGNEGDFVPDEEIRKHLFHFTSLTETDRCFADKLHAFLTYS